MQPIHEYIIPNRRDIDAEGFFLFGIIFVIGILFVTVYFGLPALKNKIKPTEKPITVTTASTH